MWKSFGDVYHRVSQLNNVLPLVLQMAENKLFLDLWSKTAFYEALCMYEANSGWWHTDQYYSLEQTSTAEGAIRPQRCLSALWYTLRERSWGDARGGRIWWVHAAQTAHGRWACVCAYERLFTESKSKKRVAFEGLTFICGTMSHLQASHRQFFAHAWGFLAHVSLKCKWTFLLFRPRKRGIKIG